MAKKNKKGLSDKELEIQDAINSTKSHENPEKTEKFEMDKEDSQIEIPVEDVIEQANNDIEKCGFDPQKPLEPQIDQVNAENEKLGKDVTNTIDESFKEVNEQLPDDVKSAVNPQMNELQGNFNHDAKEGFSSLQEAQKQLNKIAAERDHWKQIALESQSKGAERITFGKVFKDTVAQGIDEIKARKEAAKTKLGSIKSAVKSFAREVKALPVKTEKLVLEQVKKANDKLRLASLNYTQTIGNAVFKKRYEIFKESRAQTELANAKKAVYDTKRDNKVKRMERIFGKNSGITKVMTKHYNKQCEKSKRRDPEIREAAKLEKQYDKITDLDLKLYNRGESLCDTSDFNKR